MIFSSTCALLYDVPQGPAAQVTIKPMSFPGLGGGGQVIVSIETTTILLTLCISYYCY